RVVAVPNGISRTPLRADADAGRTLAGGSSYVVWIGTVEPRKDLPTLVAAFDLVADDDPDVRLVLAGQDGWGAEELTVALSRARHSDRIIRLGRIREQGRVDLLAGARCLVMASRYEGFGLPAGEAMMAGTPVIATAVGGLTELVGDAGVLVEPADAPALAQAIADLLADEPRRDHLARSGQQRAEEYTWARTVDGLARLWHRMAEV
ncbi:MAG: glycosyltransferase family 1 protein, partial [Acidimicrobiales bacterium]